MYKRTPAKTHDSKGPTSCTPLAGEFRYSMSRSNLDGSTNWRGGFGRMSGWWVCFCLRVPLPRLLQRGSRGKQPLLGIPHVETNPNDLLNGAQGEGERRTICKGPSNLSGSTQRSHGGQQGLRFCPPHSSPNEPTHAGKKMMFAQEREIERPLPHFT